MIMELLNDSELKNISQRVKPLVWIIKMRHRVGTELKETYASAFAIKNYEGISLEDNELPLMTCAHPLNESNLGIEARRLHDNDFNFKVRALVMKKSWDVALLAVEGVHDISSEFAEDGSISTCQTLVHVGHSIDFVWSVFVGRAVYPCVNHFVPFRRNETCGTYRCSSLKTTPEFRIMGHIWNAAYFEKFSTIKFKFEKNLNPFVPIIQCAGLLCKDGCSGGPVFNTEGKVVGMILGEVDGCQVAIHMSLLKEFIATAQNSSKTSDKVKQPIDSKDSGRQLKRKDPCK